MGVNFDVFVLEPSKYIPLKIVDMSHEVNLDVLLD